jgi:hypothetical protein
MIGSLRTNPDRQGHSMMRFISASLLAFIFLAPISLAHVPVIAEGNENISSAMAISDPSKSWAIYDELMPGEGKYYSFDIQQGQRIHLSLLTSSDPKDEDFTPSMVLMGPGINSVETLQGIVYVPDGYGAIAAESKRSDQAIYEPFGPSSYYQIAELDMAAPITGTYYVSVFDLIEGGSYGLVIGYRETFTIYERIISPIQLISVYRWEGQSLAFIFMPMIITLILGIFLMLRSDLHGPFSTAGFLSGLLFLGSSLTILMQIIFNLTRTQIGPEVAISLALAAIPAILGIGAINISLKKPDLKRRVSLLIIAILAALIGTGILVGPALAAIASALPFRKD